jgi:hypothetical protein
MKNVALSLMGAGFICLWSGRDAVFIGGAKGRISDYVLDDHSLTEAMWTSAARPGRSRAKIRGVNGFSRFAGAKLTGPLALFLAQIGIQSCAKRVQIWVKALISAGPSRPNAIPLR